MTCNLILCTAPNKKTAKKIAKFLLKKKLVACVNITKNINSLYYWDNKLEETNKEVQMFIKTNNSLNKIVIKELKKIHPYDIPEIIIIPIIDGNKNYIKWIDDSTLKNDY